jgi:ParB family chromosome partitioning protein
VEHLARATKKKKKPAATPQDNLPYDIKRIQDKMASHLGTRVLIKNKRGGRGEIVISYFSNDDLERLMDLMNL